MGIAPLGHATVRRLDVRRWTMTSEQTARKRTGKRNAQIALALVLGALVVLFFVMTMVRLKGHVFDWTS